MAEVTIAEALELADSWVQLGWAVQLQVSEVLQGGDITATNPNALRAAIPFLRMAVDLDLDHADVILDEFEDYLAAIR